MNPQSKSKLRFSSARQVVEAVPPLRREFEGENLEVDPVAFIRALIQANQPKKALTFCSHLLSRHDAVRWLCESLRALPQDWNRDDEALLAMAEAWVAQPSEKLRQAAFRATIRSSLKTLPAWASAAAGWAGNTVPENLENPALLPAHLTGEAAKSGIVIALSQQPAEKQSDFARAAVARALNLLYA